MHESNDENATAHCYPASKINGPKSSPAHSPAQHLLPFPNATSKIYLHHQTFCSFDSPTASVIRFLFTALLILFHKVKVYLQTQQDKGNSQDIGYGQTPHSPAPVKITSFAQYLIQVLQSEPGSAYTVQKPNTLAVSANNREMADDVPCCEGKFFLFLVVVVGLVVFAGLMAGLTLGLMSLGLVDLEVLSKSGRPQDRIHASKILPVVKNQHLLLCTLLIGNSLAMESLPIFLDKLVPPWAAIVVSVTLILVFGEILPQAICTRYGLTVGATAAPLVRLLLWLFFPIAYPISKFLDWMLGKGHAALHRRAELKTFVDFHGNEAGKGGDLTHDETTIIAGALELTEKTAKDAMTPIAKAFSLDLDGTLNLETLNAIMTMGHSRVPVYYKDPNNIIGLILVKNLLAVDPDDSVPLRKMLVRKIPRVSENMPLYDILNEFQKGHSHIAVVYRDSNETKETLQKTKEETQNFAIKSTSKEANSAPNDDQVKKSPPSTPAFKKKHKGCSFCILDLDNSPIPEFSKDQEAVGVITMEDVIEELLQEEILDETDEYVNIHNRIKINMNASHQSLPPASPPLEDPPAVQ